MSVIGSVVTGGGELVDDLLGRAGEVGHVRVAGVGRQQYERFPQFVRVEFAGKTTVAAAATPMEGLLDD